MKKLFSVVLSLALLLSVLATNTFALNPADQINVDFKDYTNDTLANAIYMGDNITFGMTCGDTQDSNGANLLSLPWGGFAYGWINAQKPANFVTKAVEPGSQFTLTTANIQNVFDALKEITQTNFQFKFYASADAVNWTAVDYSYTANVGNDGGSGSRARTFDRYTVTVPSGMYYIKVEFPQTSFYSDTLPQYMTAHGIVTDIDYSQCTQYAIAVKSISYSQVYSTGTAVTSKTYPELVTFSESSGWAAKTYMYSNGLFEYTTDIPDKSGNMTSAMRLAWGALYYGSINAGNQAYLTYYVKGGTPFRIGAIKVSQNSSAAEQALGAPLRFKLFTSTNGQDWIEAPYSYDSQKYLYSNWYDSHEFYTIDKLDDSVSYVKIVYPQTAYYNGNNGALNLESVAYTAGDVLKSQNFNGCTADNSSNYLSDPNYLSYDQVDSAGNRILAVDFNGIAYGQVNDQNPASFIIKPVEPGTLLAVTTANIQHVADQLKSLANIDMRFKFYGSSDKTNWSELSASFNPAVGNDGGSNAWSRTYDKYVMYVPKDVKYVKVAFPQTSFYSDYLNDNTVKPSIAWNFNYNTCTHYSFAVKSIDCIPAIKIGDANADGEIDTLDFTLIRKYLLGIQTEFSGKADVTGDTIVDIKDLVRLKKYFSNPQTVVLGTLPQ